LIKLDCLAGRLSVGQPLVFRFILDVAPQPCVAPLAEPIEQRRSDAQHRFGFREVVEV